MWTWTKSTEKITIFMKSTFHYYFWRVSFPFWWTLDSLCSLCCFCNFLYLLFFVLSFLYRHIAPLDLLLILRLVRDLLQLVFSSDGGWKSERRLDEFQREDPHVSVEAVLGDLQGSAAWRRHQLLLLQDEDVVGLLAGLDGVKIKNTCKFISNLKFIWN